MEQKLTVQRDSDTQVGVGSLFTHTDDQWLVLWQQGRANSTASLISQLGVAGQTQVVYSPVRQLLRQKAEALAALQERRIRKLQDALIGERLGKYKDREEALMRAVFSLYKEELMSMSEVIERAGVNRWEFFEYLDSHPEYRQVDIDSFLENVKED